jgi:TnpA family transposase
VGSRELLSTPQREAFEAIPLDRADLIKHYILSAQDLSLIHRRRGAQNRLGLAVQLALLRFPGRALLPDETPPQELLDLGLASGLYYHRDVRNNEQENS